MASSSQSLPAATLSRKLGWLVALSWIGLLSVASGQTLYWDTNGSTAGAGATPTGTWSTGTARWSSNATGTSGTIVNWTNGRDAVFSAGTDATNAYTVTVSGTVGVSSINVEEGTPTFNGGTINFSDATPDFIVGSGLTATVNSVISGGNGLVKSGNGLLIFSGSNSYTGQTTVDAGTLRVTNAVALGTTGTVVKAGGELQLSNGITVANESLSLAGTGTNGALVNVSGNNTWNGNLTLASASTIANTAAGTTLTLGSTGANRTFTNGGNTVTLDGAGNIVFNAQTSGTGDLIKNGSGTTTLSYGANSNASLSTYTGSTQVNNGTLLVDVGGNNGVPATPLTGDITVGAADGSNSALMELRYIQQVGDSTNVRVNQTGTFRLSATTYTSQLNETIGSLTLEGGGRVESIDGANTATFTLNGDVARVLNGANTAEIAGRLDLGGSTRTFDVADSAAAVDLRVSALVTDSSGAGLTKTGTGTLELTGNTTYTGATTVNAGTLLLGASNVISDSSALVIGSDGLVDLGWGHTETVASLAGSGVLDIKGGPFTAGDGTNTTFSGVIADSGGFGTFNKQGSGTLTLSGANTFSGVTNINAGVIVAGSNNALGASTFGNTIANGAALHLQNNITLTEGSFSVTGTGVGSSGAIRNLSGNNTLAATLNLGGNTALASDAGSLVASGQIGLGANTLTVSGAGNTTLSGDINGSGGLAQNGSGTLTLGGTSANSFGGALTINDGTVALAKSAGTNAVAGSAITIGDGVGTAGSAALRLDASNQIADSAGLITINADGALRMNNFSEGINTLGGTGLIDLSTSGYLTVGVNSGSSSFGGSITGTGTLEKTGSGTLTFTSNIAFNGTLTLSGGTLALNNSSLGANTLLVTANSTIDFAGVSSLNLTNLSIASGVTLTVQNWANASDYFFTQSWAGATFNTTSVAPMNQVVFTGFSSNATKWLSYDHQITPVPEPSTYGAVLIGGASLLLAWRRRRRK